MNGDIRFGLKAFIISRFRVPAQIESLLGYPDSLRMIPFGTHLFKSSEVGMFSLVVGSFNYVSHGDEAPLASELEPTCG